MSLMSVPVKRDESRCERCGSLETYLRIITMERVCRKCGYIKSIKRDNGSK